MTFKNAIIGRLGWIIDRKDRIAFKPARAAKERVCDVRGCAIEKDETLYRLGLTDDDGGFQQHAIICAACKALIKKIIAEDNCGGVTPVDTYFTEPINRESAE